jgi:hypothetical protein
MEKPYSGKLEFSDAQRNLLLALLAGPMVTVDVGATEAAVQLEGSNLVKWHEMKGWRLTPDGASLATRMAANPDERRGA